MKIKELIEAPIGDIETHGFDKPGNFIQRDRNLVTNPDKVKKLRKSFENTPFKFDLYFIDRNKPNYAFDPDNSVGYNDGYLDDLDKYIDVVLDKKAAKKEFNIEIKNDAISAIYLSNITDTDNIPLTPWIIAHRFAHSILPLPESGEYNNQIIERQTKAFHYAVEKFEDFATTMKDKARFTEFLTFRTARTGTLNMVGRKENNKPFYEELQEEILTQFIINGKVTFTIPK